VNTDEARRAESEEAFELWGDFEVQGKFFLTDLNKTLLLAVLKLNFLLRSIDVVRILQMFSKEKLTKCCL
jgi:hypothetical protein